MEPDERDAAHSDSLEHTDSAESLRQLWWTIGVTIVAMAILTYFYFLSLIHISEPTRPY